MLSDEFKHRLNPLERWLRYHVQVNCSRKGSSALQLGNDNFSPFGSAIMLRDNIIFLDYFVSISKIIILQQHHWSSFFWVCQRILWLRFKQAIKRYGQWLQFPPPKVCGFMRIKHIFLKNSFGWQICQD